MTNAPFAKILVANRGEIALRILRSAKELGCATVAVYSDADRDALHVQMADEAFAIGPAAPVQSYLHTEKLLAVAAAAHADAVHPGYGFFAENAAFARAVMAAGLTWIGPHPDAIDAMGDKVRARQAMIAAGVPVVPGGTAPLPNAAAALDAAREYGLPLALKASGGGGGKGLKVARTYAEVVSAYTTAQREAAAYFNNPEIYAERYLDDPKHIELQILADKHGQIVHVGERDCSLQRRHQKVWEEAPARIAPHVRASLRRAGITAARAIAYDSVGTIECLVVADEFYFLEMNTRIQVEHTISEEISGIDLVREQICVAAGRALPFDQEAIVLRGHAIEVRINAEDPADDFRPAPGTITAYREPGGFGVRVDSGAFVGYTITPDYDSLIAKLIVRGRDRPETLARLRRALSEFTVLGVPTTIPILQALIDFEPVIEGTYCTGTLEPFAAALAAPSPKTSSTLEAPSVLADDATVRVEVNGKLYRVRFIDLPLPTRATSATRLPSRQGSRQPRVPTTNEIYAPMHGVVVEVAVAKGQVVASGAILLVIEAMKMMNEIRAPRNGTIAAVLTKKGALVEAQTPLIRLEPAAAS